MGATINGTVRGMENQANPAFAVGAAAIPIAALISAIRFGTIQHYGVHPLGVGLIPGRPITLFALR